MIRAKSTLLIFADVNDGLGLSQDGYMDDTCTVGFISPDPERGPGTIVCGAFCTAQRCAVNKLFNAGPIFSAPVPLLRHALTSLGFHMSCFKTCFFFLLSLDWYGSTPAAYHRLQAERPLAALGRDSTQTHSCELSSTETLTVP